MLICLCHLSSDTCATWAGQGDASLRQSLSHALTFLTCVIQVKLTSLFHPVPSFLPTLT